MQEYQFKTTPFKHQAALFKATCNKPYFGLFWEQGTGKTKPTIDSASYLFENNEIDGLLLVAPNGVHLNWLTDEIPTHMPDRVRKKTFQMLFQSGKAGTKKFKQRSKELLEHKGLAVLAISYDGFMTKAGKKLVWDFLRLRRCFFVLDEAHYIKSPGAKRTKSILASGKYAPYKRILTGTPVAQGPFDIYSQVKFLSPDFWIDRNLGSFQAFKRYFGVWLTAQEVKDEMGYDPGYDKLLEYKNVDRLEGYLKMLGDRLTKDDAGLDLPPKLYSKRYFEMTSIQKKAYDELVDEYTTELENGETVEATLAIVRLLRLQQIVCGYITTDSEDEDPIVMLGNHNPRLDLCLEICEALPHKAIIWARFTKDIEQLMFALGDKACRYDGKISDAECAKSKEDFQNGDKQFFIANQSKGATGLTLTTAKTVIYYSNNFKLVDRLQSEDRAHRIGQEHPVNYIDLVCEGTVDGKIVDSLRSKFNIAAQITGDVLKEWI